MPLNPAALKQELQAQLATALARELGPEAGADPSSHLKLAAAISDIAIPLVKALTTTAVVTGGGTLGPGKIS